MKNNNAKCLVPNCTNKVRCRGLCLSHYQTAIKIIAMRQSTWAELEANGKVLPKQTRHLNKAPAWMLDFKNQPVAA